MAKGPGFIHYTGTRGGCGQPKKIQKAWSMRKGQNNLICPQCGVTCDRKDVKIWLDRNYGECPSCFKKVHFELHRPVGRPAGYVKKEEIQFTLNQNIESEIEKEKEVEVVPIPTPTPAQSVKENTLETLNRKTFSDYVARMKEIKNPCKYLTCDDITRLTSVPYNIVASIKRKLKYKMHSGKRSELAEMFRQAVLTAIREGFIPPDLKHFKE